MNIGGATLRAFSSGAGVYRLRLWVGCRWRHNSRSVFDSVTGPGMSRVS